MNEVLLAELRRCRSGEAIHAWQIWKMCHEQGIARPWFADDLVLNDDEYNSEKHRMGRLSHLDEAMRQRYFDFLCQYVVSELRNSGMTWEAAHEALSDRSGIPFETIRNAITRASKRTDF